MTTTVPAAPGAVIDIKLSEQAMAHAGPLFARTLGTNLDRLFTLQMQAVDVASREGKVVSGTGFNVKLDNDMGVQINGTVTELPFKFPWGETVGGIVAHSLTVATAPIASSVMTGSLNYGYFRDNENISPVQLWGNISQYRHTITDVSLDSVYGGFTAGADGKLELFPTDYADDASNQETVLRGTLSQLTFNASKLLKNEIINGKLSISASQVITYPASEIFDPSAIPKKTISVAVEGSVSSYEASYYDASYIRISGNTQLQASRETSILTALGDGDRWAGNDKLSIILPDKLEQSIDIHTGDGNDIVTAKGGGGELTIDTGNGDDQITLLDEQSHLSTGEGTDTLRAAFTEVYMSNYSGLENFVFTGREAANITGNPLDNQITGGNFDDQLRGEQGDDVLQGLGGADHLSGGLGDDQLFGGAGNDVLAGSEGVDTLWGGAGNDLYLIEDESDVVNESRSASQAADAGGIDTVWSYIDHYTLGAYIENLTLMGNAISGQGNALANTIIGNDLNNTLSGEAGNDTLYGLSGNDRLDGGAGMDTLWGGAGDDTYVVDHAKDRLFEAIASSDPRDAGGSDTVESSISFTLAQDFENLVLTGKGHLNGTGNDADNRITGNEGNNIIDGKGGIDSLNGGEGSDIYLIGSADEHRATEFADNGIRSGDVDEVRFAPKPPVVAAGTPTTAPVLKLFEGDTGIERVVIGTGTGKLAVSSGKLAAGIDASELSNDLTLVGNAGNNVLTGTRFNDTLIGNGGNDTLIGGEGSDKFVFNMTPNAKTDVDTLMDFSHGEDQLVFVRSKFANIGPAGALAEGAFYAGEGITKAQDADDRFLFDTHSGNLYFDRDGSGSSAAVLIGVLTPGSSLSATDFKIVDVI
ncbi:MAG: calcium-binding protein [Oxalobacteraceae bacterium]